MTHISVGGRDTSFFFFFLMSPQSQPCFHILEEVSGSEKCPVDGYGGRGRQHSSIVKPYLASWASQKENTISLEKEDQSDIVAKTSVRRNWHVERSLHLHRRTFEKRILLFLLLNSRKTLFMLN